MKAMKTVNDLLDNFNNKDHILVSIWTESDITKRMNSSHLACLSESDKRKTAVSLMEKLQEEIDVSGGRVDWLAIDSAIQSCDVLSSTPYHPSTLLKIQSELKNIALMVLHVLVSFYRASFSLGSLK